MKLSVLTKRVGPFALWVWLSAGAAGLIVLRHLRSSSSTTTGGVGSPTSSTDTGAGAYGLGTPALGGGGDAGQPLQPDQQSPIDNSLANGGTGTPVVFDPTTGTYSQPGDYSTIGPDQPADTISPPPPPDTIHGGPPGPPFGGAPKLTLPTLPKITTGQKSPKKKTTKKNATAAAAHPPSKAGQPGATSGRNQGHAPAAVARPRSSTPARVEAIPHDARPAPPPPPPPKPVAPARGSSKAKLA